MEQDLIRLKGQVQELLKKSRRQFRNSIITIGVLLFVTAVSMLYAFIQQTAAVKARYEAVANAEEAVRQEMAAEALAKALNNCKEEVASKSK